MESPNQDAGGPAAGQGGLSARGFVFAILGVLALAVIALGVAVGRSWAPAGRDENASQACSLQGDRQGLAAAAVKDGATRRGYMCVYRAGDGRIVRREPLRTAP